MAVNSFLNITDAVKGQLCFNGYLYKLDPIYISSLISTDSLQDGQSRFSSFPKKIWKVTNYKRDWNAHFSIASTIWFCLFTKARLGQTNMAVLFRRLTKHMQRFDGLFSSALLKSKILYITQGYLHFSHPVLHKYWSLQFIEWCLFSAYISERFWS